MVMFRKAVLCGEHRGVSLEVLMCFVVFLQAIEDVVDGGAHGVYLTFAGGAVLSEFAASRPAWGRCAALSLPGGRQLGVSRLL